jgi:allantoate deiminase
MMLRRDALAATAEWLMAVEAIALATPGLVATAGKIAAEPGAANVIPELCRCTLDVRHANDEIRLTALRQILASADAIAVRRQIAVEHSIEVDQAAVALDPVLTSIAEKAVLATGHPAPRMISGAGHDAMIVAAKIPAAMIFLRSPGGISHHPDESVLAEDVAAALRAGLNFLDLFEDHLFGSNLESESSCTI